MNLFESDISQSLKQLGVWGHRDSDSAYGKENSACDFFMLHNNIFYGIECKMVTDGSKSISFGRVTVDQQEGLLEIQHQGGKGYILFNFRWMGPGNTKGKVFIISIVEFLYLQHAMKNYDKFKEKYPRNDSSIPLKYFQDCAEEMDRLKLYEGGYGWNLLQLTE